MAIIIFIVIALIVLFLVLRKHKKLTLNTCVFVDGAPKTGKDLLCMKIIDKEYKKALFKNRIYNLFHKEKKLKPLIYSNVPLKTKYGCYKLSQSIIERKEKIIDNSIVFIGEYSLFADSRLGLKNSKEDLQISNDLLLFHKLCGHQWNGKLITNSQCVSDCHYSNKRTLSNYYYILHSKKLPFFHLLEVVELLNSEDSVNVNALEDIEERKKYFILVSKKYYKMYDYRAFSKLYDNLPVACEKYNSNNLKVVDLISFNKSMRDIYNGGVSDEQEKN